MSFFHRHKSLLRLILLFLLISTLLAGLLHWLGLFDHFNQTWVDNTIRGQGTIGVVYFLLVIALAISISLPRQVAAFAAGYAFGFIHGTLISTLAAAIGCVITYSVARFIFARYIRQKFANKVKLVYQFLSRDTFEKTFIIRLIPAGSNFLLNVCAGIAHIHPGKFFSASYLGYFPQMAIFALAGSGVQLMSFWQIGASVLLSIIATLLSFRLYNRYQQELAQQGDEKSSNSATSKRD
ncbi:VTT domain-containing protein [Thalassotalea ponticola]|uniref:TVP38/TMEM64 family protein n=1 Tax=Thalassotalea ponticola TaxID=1523392 RepID=UPI0025B5D7C3|nr:VTT domain-containing protein [Thalassotalea ponticola]MDN3652442.1 VTT domain-containing protein [Thalassotalea ponticola]